MRFISTCCNCTRSAMTWVRSKARAVRICTSYRVASLRKWTIISRITSFTSTNSRCEVPFWKSRRIRLMISPARVPSFTILMAAARGGNHQADPPALHIRMIARKPTQAGVGVGDGGGNRLVHFVSQSGSQLSHGGHPADAREIRLRLTQRLLGTFSVLDVDTGSIPLNDV